MKPWQVAQVAHDYGGFRGKALIRAVAVALAESGGRTDAVNTNTDKYRSRDRGLWQINDHWHPEVSDADAFTPARAAAHAYRISHAGRDWSAWSTWNNGSAQAQLGRARLGVSKYMRILGTYNPNAGSSTGGKPNAQQAGWDPNLPGPSLPGPLDPFGLTRPGGPDAGDVLDAVTTVPRAMAGLLTLGIKSGAWIANPDNWLRVAMVVGGTGGLVLGLGMLARSGALGGGAAEVAAMPARGLKTAANAGAMAATGGGSVIAKGAATVSKTATTATKTTAKALAS